jgi:nicotinamide/nicotinate riboside kinase
VHPVHNVQDWDAAPGAIAWPRLITFLQHVKEIGEIPADHRSHDHLNEQKEIMVDDAIREKWIAEFQQLKKKWTTEGERVVWGLVDGFLLYWHKVRARPLTA